MGSSGSHPAASVAPPPRTAVPVAAGDVLVIVGALVAGSVSHGVSPVANPLRVVGTLVPFLVGWIVLALVLGAYDPAALSDPVGSVRVGAGAWVGAANVGLILRQSPYFHGDVTYPFPLVVTGTVLVGLVVWRTVAAAVLVE